MAEKLPKDWTFENGEIRLWNLPIAAALLSINGAAISADGQWFYPGEDKAAFDAVASRPGMTVIRTALAGSHNAPVETLLRSAWVDKSPEGQGRHYTAGETAPVPHVWFHIRGAHEGLVNGTTVRRAWTADDAAAWILRFHKPGNAFVVNPAVCNDWVNKLRNHIRDRYGFAQRWEMPR